MKIFSTLCVLMLLVGFQAAPLQSTDADTPRCQSFETTSNQLNDVVYLKDSTIIQYATRSIPSFAAGSSCLLPGSAFVGWIERINPNP